MEDYRSERLRCGDVEQSLSHQILSTKKAEKAIDRGKNVCYTHWHETLLANVRIVPPIMRNCHYGVAKGHFAIGRLKHLFLRLLTTGNWMLQKGISRLGGSELFCQLNSSQSTSICRIACFATIAGESSSAREESEEELAN